MLISLREGCKSNSLCYSILNFCRLGILVEVNCETDFVARGEVFQGLASDIAMQLASNAQVESISKDEFPQDLLDKERQVALQMEDIQSKPENIRYKTSGMHLPVKLFQTP